MYACITIGSASHGRKNLALICCHPSTFLTAFACIGLVAASIFAALVDALPGTGFIYP